MDKEFEKIIKTVKNIKLSDNEKVFMRNHILNEFSPSMQNESPVIKSSTNRLYFYYQDFKNNYFMINKSKFVGAFAMVGIVFITGGTSAFAEKSVPGDFLYKVKVSVNEPLAGVFAFTKEEKTEWKERIIERRLKEAHHLASIGKLDEAKRSSLEENIKNEVAIFNTSVNELSKEEGKVEKSSDLSIRLQASLQAYQSVLGNMIEKEDSSDDNKKETGKFIAVLENSKNKSRDDNKNLELGLRDDGQTIAKNLLDSIKLLYQKEKINLSVNIQNQIDAKFALAEESLKNNKPNVVITELNSIKLLMLSNVIKGEIEDDHGIDNDDDIEEHEIEIEHGDEGEFEDEDDSGRDEQNSRRSHSDEIEFED